MTAKKRVLPMLFALLLAGGASVAQACDWAYGEYGYGPEWMMRSNTAGACPYAAAPGCPVRKRP